MITLGTSQLKKNLLFKRLVSTVVPTEILTRPFQWVRSKSHAFLYHRIDYVLIE